MIADFTDEESEAQKDDVTQSYTASKWQRGDVNQGLYT